MPHGCCYYMLCIGHAVGSSAGPESLFCFSTYRNTTEIALCFFLIFFFKHLCILDTEVLYRIQKDLKQWVFLPLYNRTGWRTCWGLKKHDRGLAFSLSLWFSSSFLFTLIVSFGVHASAFWTVAETTKSHWSRHNCALSQLSPTPMAFQIPASWMC